jgi:hypothetical protein
LTKLRVRPTRLSTSRAATSSAVVDLLHAISTAAFQKSR